MRRIIDGKKKAQRNKKVFPVHCFVKFLLIFAFCWLSVPSAYALLNPSAVYCTALGYTYVTSNTPMGTIGYCILPSGEKADAWQFLQGFSYTKYSYCSQKGYQIKTITDPDRCVQFLTDSCSVCVLSNGTEVEVTSLMGLSFNETKCGDGTCGIPENYQTCPSDCPSGSIDGYCDKVADGKCDIDCPAGQDPDCSVPQNTTLVVTTLIATTPLPTPTRAGLSVLLITIEVLGILIIMATRWKR